MLNENWGELERMQKSVTVEYCKVIIQENATGYAYGHILYDFCCV